VAIDYSVFAIPKNGGRLVVEEKRSKRLSHDDAERICREAVRKRDHGKCVIPGCKEAAAHQHHIVYRSRSRALKYAHGNRCSLCVAHHQLVHGGKITISGNADDHLTIEGDKALLKFKL
jgi:hypothetical protein